MKTSTLALLFCLAAAAVGNDARAQFGEDGGPEKIKQIVKEVAEQMQEIDRLLLRSTAPDKGAAESAKEAAKNLARSVENIDKLLEQTTKNQTEVVRGIDDLIKEIEKMRSSGT
jgi:methyl-accepting chemotaxis protein